MSLPVVLGREAEAEFDEAVDWYERQAGLGAKFVAAVRGVLTRITEMPELHPKVHGEIRCAIVTRFPYGIYYRVWTDRVEVVAVFHGRRDPSVWRKRV